MPTQFETSEKEEIHYTEDVRQDGSVSSTEAEKGPAVIIDNEPAKSFEGTPEEKAYLRRLNWWFMPLVGMIIFVQFCDKASLSVGPVLGLNADLRLTGTQFSLAGSLFYLGALIFQIPNQFILQRVPHGKYLGALLVIWGLVMGATGACQTFPQFAACRFLLGLFESAAIPTLYLVAATLYRRSEQAMVFGYITLCNGVGAAIGTVVAYGFAHLNNARGIKNWRWNHITFGSLTVLLGIIAWFFLIDKPDHKLLKLNETEKLIAKDRTRDNAVVKNRVYKYRHIWESVKEPRYWLLLLSGMMIALQNGGMLVFSTTLVLGLGFNHMDSLLLQIPSGLAGSLGVFAAVLLAHKTKQLIWSAMFMITIGVAGLIILCAIPDGAIKLLGFYLSWAGAGSYALLVTYIGNNVKGYTKKIFYNGSVTIAYTIGNFVGPLMMVEHQAPRYLGGVGGFLGGFVVAFFCYFLIRIQGARINRKRLANSTGEETDVYLDLTDKEDKNFIFRL
ncbi:major facilitator superfamily domain-containing protein [Fennellomyces sp. T-0311]|nr:major facilitator superfamily domain-containing protein [Fennellomyces sp. T-0311]